MITAEAIDQELAKQDARDAVRDEYHTLGYNRIAAKTHPNTRRIRDTRTTPRDNALEFAAASAMRGATEIEPINRNDIHAKTNGTCYVCGRTTTTNTFHVDHVIPLYHGGAHTWANLYPACPTCNEAKGTHTIAVEIATGDALIL